MNFIDLSTVDGFIHAVYQTNRITLPVAKEIVAERLLYTKGESMPYLIEGLKLSSIDKAARDYFSSDEGSQGVSAAAFVSHSAFQVNLLNFFLKVTTQKMPVMNFVSKEEAKKWLRQFAPVYAIRY
jgi:hypothetical protein